MNDYFNNNGSDIAYNDPYPNIGNDSGFSDGGGDFGGDYSAPVLLNLDGNGLAVTPLSSSNQYYDMAGDGRQHRTAWAAAGNAVLVYDTNGDGKITQRNQVVFTDWDPTATSDMQALQDVFDTNHNGKLDAGDAAFAKFKLLVTNADGTTSLQTLAAAGIASINLIPDASKLVLPDGSTVDGQASYTRTNGTTGIAAAVTLHSDAYGYILKQTVTHNGDGSTTIDNKALNPDGSVAKDTVLLTSADGRTRTLSFDDTGDGVVDRIQTIVSATNAGVVTETLTNRTGAGVVLNTQTTVTSADKKTITITRDANGDGLADQKETRVTAADGTNTVTVSDFNPDGSLVHKTVSVTAASGLTRTVTSDFDGNATTDLTHTDATVVNADQSRTDTVTDKASNASLIRKTVTTTSADGTTKTTSVDRNGDGVFDLTTMLAIVLAADHSSTSTVTDKAGNGTLIDKTVTAISADGLSRTTQTDIDGDGVFDHHRRRGWRQHGGLQFVVHARRHRRLTRRDRDQGKRHRRSPEQRQNLTGGEATIR